MRDWDVKKDFMVVWEDNKGKEHKTKVIKKVCSARDAMDWIEENRTTCKKTINAWWI